MDVNKKNPTLDKNFLINAIGNSNLLQPQNNLQMPELALRCSQFFHSLSQYCLHFYKNYNKEADVQKTKLIKKAQKSRKDKHDKKTKHSEAKRRDPLLKGQNQPQPPKKPLTAYIIYFQDKKPSFAEKFPSLSLSQLTKLIAKDWKQLDDSEKKPYLDKAADDRKRYEEQMIQFRSKYNNKQGGDQLVIKEAPKSKNQAIPNININGEENQNGMEVEAEQEKQDIQQQKRESNQNENNQNSNQNQGMDEQLDNDNQNQNNQESQNDNDNQNENENGEQQQNNSEQQGGDADQQNQDQEEADNDNDNDNDNEQGGAQSSEK